MITARRVLFSPSHWRCSCQAVRWLCRERGGRGEEKWRNMFGFQSSDFEVAGKDATLLERSLRLGSNVFVCSAGRSKEHFERLAELSNIEDVDLDGLVIGNRVRVAESFESETESAVESLCGRCLDFSTIPLSLHALRGDDNTFSQALTSLHTSSEGIGGGAVGVELNTELLRHCQSQDSSSFKSLPLNSSMVYPLNRLFETLDSLREKCQLSVILCASNVFTYPTAVAIRGWAADKTDVTIMATELLRGHPRSPGQLVAPSAATGGIGSLPNVDMSDAMEFFKKTLNTCIHFEKEFLNKARQLNVDGERSSNELPNEFPFPPDLCIGMVLAKSQHTILFPQEWAFACEVQLDPNFDKACATLRKGAGDSQAAEYENFLTVYIPMKRNLVRAFEAVLNARQELLCRDLKAAAEIKFPGKLLSVASDGSSEGKYSYSNMSLHECLAKAWAGVVIKDEEYQSHRDVYDTVLLSGVEVPADLWRKSETLYINEESGAYVAMLSEELSKEYYDNNA